VELNLIMKNKQNNINKNPYPNITKLGIKIYNEPYPHCKFDEIHTVLKRNKLNCKLFSKYYGSQTCIVVDGKGCPYPWDIDPIIERLLTGKIVGSQKYWD
jgi:hypothetical protein